MVGSYSFSKNVKEIFYWCFPTLLILFSLPCYSCCAPFDLGWLSSLFWGHHCYLLLILFPLQSPGYSSSTFVSDTKTFLYQLASKASCLLPNKMLRYWLIAYVEPYFPSPLAISLYYCSGEVLGTPCGGKYRFLMEVCADPIESKYGHSIFP